nr:immunoglobulin light chain junction region [Macaca mulatta]
CQQGYSYPLTS